MKYIVLILVVFTFCSGLYSQEDDTKSLFSKVIKSQIDFERQGNKYSSMNIMFIDDRFDDMKLTYDGVVLNNLKGKELKSKSRKGLDIIEIYPIKLFENKIIVETLSIFKKKKKVTIYGKSSYFFEYDCKEAKYVLVDKIQKMI